MPVNVVAEMAMPEKPEGIDVIVPVIGAVVALLAAVEVKLSSAVRLALCSSEEVLEKLVNEALLDVVNLAEAVSFQVVVKVVGASPVMAEVSEVAEFWKSIEPTEELELIGRTVIADHGPSVRFA